MEEYKITKEEFESIFDYDGEDYEPGIALLNFYSLLVYDIINVEDFNKIDGKYIKISEKLYNEIFNRIQKDARKSDYPDYPTENKEVSTKQGMYQWINSGPSSDENLDKYTIVVEDGAIIK